MNSQQAQWFATLGPLGFWPAPGTLASIVTVGLVWLLSLMPYALELYSISLIVVTGFSIFCINRSLTLFNASDPSEIVLDEVVGCLVVFWNIPLTCSTILVGLCVFRILDIYKPLGIAHIERIGGWQGIVLDDVVAGLIAHGVLRVGISLFGV